MKNKNIKPSVEIRLPELKIHGPWNKSINWICHISPIFWILSIATFLTLFLTLTPNFMLIYLWDALKAQGILVSLLLIFSLVSVSLVWSTGQRIDVWVLTYINMHGTRASWLDWLMLSFTQIGNGVFAIIVAFIMFLKVDHRLSYELTFGTLTLWLVVELVKAIIHRTRPYMKLINVRIVGSRASGHSFPSGHTSQAFFMATLMLNYYHGGVCAAIAAYSIASLVGITRIYVGMHYPRDVMGGAILGTSWGLLGVIINNYFG